MTAGARLLEAAGHGIERLFSTELEPHLVVAEQLFEQFDAIITPMLADAPPHVGGIADRRRRHRWAFRAYVGACPLRRGGLSSSARLASAAQITCSKNCSATTPYLPFVIPIGIGSGGRKVAVRPALSEMALWSHNSCRP